MKLLQAVLFITICLWVSLSSYGVCGLSPESDTGETTDDRYTPEYILSMGETLDSPLLKLLGLVALCSGQPPCSQWSQWSGCSVEVLGQFGTRNRSRTCGIKDSRCQSTTEPEVDSDVRLCEGFCPNDYTLTKHGFCLKYTEQKVTHGSAMWRCKQDGGHIVNINSKVKLDDMKTTFKVIGVFLVDGVRLNPSSPWKFTYGGPPDDMNWGPGEPDDVNNEHCMGYSNRWVRFDGWCTVKRNYMCEVLPNN